MLALVPTARAATVTLIPSQDNTLIQTSDGSLSNGAGSSLFAGRTSQPAAVSRRRAVIAFDVAGAVPAGSTIMNVTLRLTVSRTNVSAGTVPVALHFVTSDWGEGTSDASFLGGGSGAPSTPGDATWIHTFFDTEFWGTPGGDFDPTPSAVVPVGGNATYEWSTEAMRQDAQAWLDDAASNFGWIVIGEESTSTTSKRFNSRENSATATRPMLIVEFVPEPGRSVGTLALTFGLAALRAARRGNRRQCRKVDLPACAPTRRSASPAP